MWTELAKFLSFVSRLGAFAMSVVSLALVSLTLSERDWMDGMSIYIVAVSCLSILVALVPPYPNFVIDSFFALAWIMAAVFSFLIMFLKSTCYGVADPGSIAVACPKYKAFVAFCFLTFGAWAACASFGLLLFIIAIFKNARLRSNHYIRDPTIYKGRYHGAGALSSSGPATADVQAPPLARNAGFPNDRHADFASDTPQGSANEKPTGYTSEKYGTYYDEKFAKYPYEKIERLPSKDNEEDKILPVTAPAAMPNMSHNQLGYAPEGNEHGRYEEEEWAPKEPEYIRVRGLFSDFILANWVWLGLAGIVLMAVILPIVIIYGVPAFAYYVLDNIQVPKSLYGEITAFEESYATFNIMSSIRAPSGISASIDPTTLQMFNPETVPISPIAYIDTGKIKIKGGETIHANNGQIRVGNMTEWTKLWRKFFFDPVMTVGLKGSLKLHVGPLKISVDTVKTVSYQGILNATVLQLEYLKIQPPDADGANVLISLPLVNPAILTLNSTALVTADFTIGQTLLAEAFIDNFNLKKGLNYLDARARVDLEIVLGLLQNITQVIGTELPYMANGILVTGLQTTNITADGHSWPYWVRAFRGIDLLAGIELSSVPPSLLTSVASDAIAGILTGTGGSFITQEPGGVIDVNTTLINKILRNLTIIDASSLNL
ncbi:uncharacterized protein PV09_03158 [Verruconis gallopava]|uniref:Uncharacterized protein n=1 Tax=Verruconis gallopava TaxID=253628 RepID=A0A0D2AG91_9PEZI|nr:uncharacterized protein PV09_03158 [Verruconis gallopava]KIW05973.1 hypothetical protein PV09_03158 [Verruconis gallopava]